MTRIWQHKAKALKFYCGFNLVTLVFVSGCPITCHPSISKWSVAAFSLGMWITVNKETSVLSVGCSSSGGPQPWSVEETWAKGCWCHGLDTGTSLWGQHIHFPWWPNSNSILYIYVYITYIYIYIIIYLWFYKLYPYLYAQSSFSCSLLFTCFAVQCKGTWILQLGSAIK